ncbi:hypothetical protein GLAREA_10656 [Glarea lozoyensis ATCC 20868]|uniref:Myb-like DNA-binding domain-containing protein n=1 Tax=Glarea lozoyensis (strain ATCC 20868 / MF5171) TaxID=1116229 RepID=S3DSL4_GLAL2|nr:uncharacterized protein GLAREA_10656 [Glarea lozoyensis ATCC 20868]EPE34961.1 hypothetical protein GLAREA_10656 [Glarea lozoyensis ATCC 20868]
MPSKIQLDENLWFLYTCLQNSDMKLIDFQAVAEAANIKSPAARMRYTRLKRQLEDGTLLGTRGTSFCPRNTKNMIARKRGRPCKKTALPCFETSTGKEVPRKQEVDDGKCNDPTIRIVPFEFAPSAGDSNGSHHSEFRTTLSPSPSISFRPQQLVSALPRKMNLTSDVPPPPFQFTISAASLTAADGRRVASRDESGLFGSSQQDCEVACQREPLGERVETPIVIKSESPATEEYFPRRSWAPGVWVSGVQGLKRKG